jgi:hypothetical protein
VPTPRRVLGFAVLLAVALSSASAAELRLETENDLLSKSATPDDLYTFSFAAAVEQGPLLFSLRENAFTDRAAGIRFDETYLSVGRSLAWRGFALSGEIGVAHVGKGLLGQGAQNTVHRWIDDDQVYLRYGSGSLHPHAAFVVQRPLATTAVGDFAAIADADVTPGLKSVGFVGARAVLAPRAPVSVDVAAGARFAHASLESLEPHLERAAPAVRISILLRGSVYVSWSVNQFGDGREHLSAGYRFGSSPTAAGLQRIGVP